MKKTKAKLKTEFDKINSCSLVTYMRILGHQPTFVSDAYVRFKSPFPDWPDESMIIHVKTNRFYITCDVPSGGVIDLARHLFHVSPQEILNDIVPYRIDQLMSSAA